MSAYDAEAIEGTDLQKRDVRALTEVMTVLSDQGDVRGADGLHEVVSGSGSTYLVDSHAGTCSCRDYEKREPTGGCKHVRRVAFVTGDRRIPAWVDADALDDEVRDAYESDESSTVDVVDTPAGEQAIATDGGAQLAEQRVCDDCANMSGVPCFDCYLAGYRDIAGAVESDGAVDVKLGVPSEGA